jgi:hypothetical protein
MENPQFFPSCQEQYPDGTAFQIIECVSDAIEIHNRNTASELKNFLFVLCGAMIFFMQAGFAVLCAGAVRIKNVQNTMLKNLLDACGAAIAFFLFGEYKMAGVKEKIKHEDSTLMYDFFLHRLRVCLWRSK